MKVFAIFSIIPLGLEAKEVLKQSHVIFRSGARNPLSHISRGNAANGRLSVLGEREMTTLGEWLNKRYQDLMENHTGDFDRIESTDCDNSITSANIIAEQLFPSHVLPDGTVNVPVHATDISEDVVLHAYDKCPAFQDILDTDLYRKERWNDMEQKHVGLLRGIGEIEMFAAYKNKDGYVPLKFIHSVFNRMESVRLQCLQIQDPNCIEARLGFMPSKDAWQIIESLAHFAEINKYHRDVAGNLLGGNLLHLMKERLENPSQEKIFVYSAHYQTLLSLFAAMGLISPNDEILPGYGSALLFEIYQNDQSKRLTMRLFFKSPENDDAISVQIPGPCGGALECPMDQSLELLEENGFGSMIEWCNACNNNSTNTCKILNDGFGQPGDFLRVSDECPPSNKKDTSGIIIFITWVLGAIFGTVVCGLVFQEKMRQERITRAKAEERSFYDDDNVIDLEDDAIL